MSDLTNEGDDRYAPPEAQSTDKALAITRAATGSIPLVGNAVNELMLF